MILTSFRNLKSPKLKYFINDHGLLDLDQEVVMSLYMLLKVKTFIVYMIIIVRKLFFLVNHILLSNFDGSFPTEIFVIAYLISCPWETSIIHTEALQ